MTLKRRSMGAPGPETAARAAETARIGMDEGEIEALARYMDELLDFADRLADAPTGEIGDAPSSGEAREDVVIPSDVRSSVLEAAHSRRDSFFVVPRILDEREDS
ncbi:MAG: hypothetical protein GX181_01975 [Synergistaceae bacterium]|nr:aspartyl/glutamyl-tRNA amidotransferase subunit C [Synergistota bacterium]NLM70714.1 hypothetical protein [Synergistaceae bacterium]